MYSENTLQYERRHSSEDLLQKCAPDLRPPCLPAVFFVVAVSGAGFGLIWFFGWLVVGRFVLV